MSNYVSLLSAEYRREMEKARRLRGLRRVAAAAAAVALLLAAASVGLRMAGEKEISDLRARNAQVENQITGMLVYETLQQELEGLKGKIVSVRGLDAGWIATIADIADALPEGVWIERLGTAKPDEDGSYLLVMECAGNRLADISQTMQALEEHVAQSTHCTTSSELGGTVRFSLTVTLAPSDQAKGAAV
jgi:hypothetical protein